MKLKNLASLMVLCKTTHTRKIGRQVLVLKPLQVQVHHNREESKTRHLPFIFAFSSK